MEEELNGFWHGLSCQQKLALRHYFVSGQPSAPVHSRLVGRNRQGARLLSNDVLLRFGKAVARSDPRGFLSLKSCCKRFALILPNLFDAIGHRFDIHLHKLLYRLNRFKPQMHLGTDGSVLDVMRNDMLRKHPSGPFFGIATSRVFDEKCRYVKVQPLLSTGVANCSFCYFWVDKLTGLITNNSPNRSSPIGSIYESHPEITCFELHTSWVAIPKLYTIKERKKVDPEYKARLAAQWKKEFQDATQRHLQMGSYSKKRMFASLWDENDVRRQKLKGNVKKVPKQDES